MKRLHDGHYKMDNEGAIWIDVCGFSIKIQTTDEGVLVDIFNAKELDQELHANIIGSTYVFYHELESAHE
jgi:hypothetical protein